MDWAAIVLGLAALGGLTIAVMRLSGTPRPPTWIALGHGAVAATGLGLLIYQAYQLDVAPPMIRTSIVTLILAALGGATLFLGFHLRERALPIPLVLAHGIIAIAGYGMLLFSLYGGAAP